VFGRESSPGALVLWLGCSHTGGGVPVGRRLSKNFLFQTDQLKLHLPVFGSLNLICPLAVHPQSRDPLPFRHTIIQALELCQRA